MRKAIVLLFCLRSLASMSQDIHISQFWVSPIAINPAGAGFFDGDARIGIYNRTQWKSISKAYQTIGSSADFALLKRPAKQDLFGMGVLLDYDQAGDSKYTILQGSLLFSYAHALNSRNNSFLMGGISIGGAQRSWSYSQLLFDQQFQNGAFHPEIGTGETFQGTNYWLADMGLGIQWFYQPGFFDFYQVGFSVYHLNRPRITMLKADNIRLPVKWVAHAIVSIEVNRRAAVLPTVYVAVQDQYREFLIGATYSHSLAIDVKGFINQANIGLFYRWNDALYLSCGMNWRRLTFGISYDFNVSKLSKASQARGGIEIALSYIIKKKRYLKQRAIPCAVF